jgi:hypothetical protein
MLDLYLPVIALVGMAVLAALCLPFSRIQKLVLELSAFGLRLALLALLGAAVYLWFYPGDVPAEVADTFNTFLNTSPRLKAIVPEPGTQYFGICAAACVVVMLLPLLAVLDVSRKLAGWRLRRLRALAVAPPVVATAPAPAPATHRVTRRAAADVLADAGSRKPFRDSPPS